MNSESHTTDAAWALVTGGSSRGGAAISRRLHARGLSVIVHHTARSREEAQSLQAELESVRAGTTRLWEADFLSEDFAVPSWIRELDVQVLICNASVYVPSGIGDRRQLAEDWTIHVVGHAVILAALGPESTSLRSVVAISDIAVARAPRGHVGYTIAKGGLETMMLTLATEWAPRVRFNVVQAGTLPFPDNWTDVERANKIEASIPLARIGSFSELADTVAFLALDAHYVTGQVLAVDGGRSRHLH